MNGFVNNLKVQLFYILPNEQVITLIYMVSCLVRCPTWQWISDVLKYTGTRFKELK